MAETTPTESQVLEALRQVVDPELNKPLSDLGMLKGAEIEDGRVNVSIELPTTAYPDPERITEAVRLAIRSELPQICDVEVTFSAVVKGRNTGGKIGLTVHNVVAIGSGKGGVGKSTVAAALAYGLKNSGARVGLMDADVYGPSIPHIVGATGRPAMIEKRGPEGQAIQKIVPIEKDGLKLVSIGFLVPPEQAVIWRGPMLHNALSQFLQQTEWGELDYLIIDLPPGTGDVSLTLSQLLGLAGAVVVCTPQQVALLDAVKAINMFRQVKIPVLGIVENMSGEIFGRGGAKAKAEELGIPFLGEIPSDAIIRIKTDEGDVGALFDADCPVRPRLMHVAERVAMEIVRQLLGGESPAAPTLEIL